MSVDATLLVYPVVCEHIGTKKLNEEHREDPWVFINIFGHLLVMIDVKYGNTMNCFETLIKIEYSNIFFAVQSFVGVEIGSFYATYVDNRYDRGCLLGVGVDVEIEWTAFACFFYCRSTLIKNT